MSHLQQELSNINISDCLNTLNYEAYFKGQRVNVFLSFIPFRNGQIDTSCFLKLIKDQIIVNFILTYKEIQKQYQRREKIAAEKYLYDKAIRKITQSTAKGKLGELLLYIFLEKFFNAPKILSKISNLADNNDQVKGADAVHAQFDGNSLVLYLGESKLWKRYNGACADAVDSIRTTLNEYQAEFDLIESNIDFPNINDDCAREIIKILNPYYSAGSLPNLHSPCFIGFDSTICKGVRSAKDYEIKYTKAAQKRINIFYEKAVNHLDIDKITLILLPFKSIEAFTAQFITTMGIGS